MGPFSHNEYTKFNYELSFFNNKKCQHLGFFCKRYPDLSSKSRISISFVKYTKISYAFKIAKDIS
jgi:hypothetical protein